MRIGKDSSGDATRAERTLATVDPFREWPAASLRMLGTAARTLELAVGQTLVAQRQQVKGIYVIASGDIEVGTVSDDGRSYVRRFAHPGMLFGMISVLDGQGSPYSYIAHERSTLLFVPKDALLSALAHRPILWESVARFVAGFQRKALAAIDENMFVPLRNRLARTLVTLAMTRGAPAHPPAVAVRVRTTQHDVANLLGVSRQSVSRELKLLERQGLVRIDYRAITLLDPSAVGRYAA